ncbi:MAG: hypothetical protein H6970_00065 [Gammaproteobacteria bacterium]|nr:hypothetical protein [Gammaproteobacteria bacterium]MCP5458790.1 hypothetical protein [Gammaproteobacteria bacterium]
MNQDNQPLSLAGPEDARQALLALLEGVRRSLHLYTPYVDPRLYDDAQVLDTLRSRIVSQPRLRFCLLLPPAAEWRRECPRLVNLAERLSSSMELRTPAPDEPRERKEFGQSICLADEAGLLYLLDPRRLVGSFTPQRVAASREMMNFFQGVWEKSQADPELRNLRL